MDETVENVMNTLEAEKQATLILCEQCAGRDYCCPSCSCEEYIKTVERMKGKNYDN